MDNNELLELLKKLFSDEISKNSEYQKLAKKITSSSGNYEDAENLGYEIGDALSKTFAKGITDDILVDGYLTENTANEAIRPLLVNGYDITTDASKIVQQAINDGARIGMKPVTAPINNDRLNGILNKATSDLYENTKWVLDEPVKNYMQSIPVEHLEKNFKTQGRSGLKPKLIRKMVGGCCDWCRNLAGTYSYPNVPPDVYKRHRNCRCTVDYYPTGKGKSQNVWDKSWKNEDQPASPNSPSNKVENISSGFGRDVTEEYRANARPGEGLVGFDEGYDIYKHKKEVEVANFLNEQFGGNIKLINESFKKNVKTPDYLWNDKLWDLKTLSTEKSADGAIRRGLKQIKDNPGGIILDYRDANVDLEKLLSVIKLRMKRKGIDSVDVMIMLKDDLKIKRY